MKTPICPYCKKHTLLPSWNICEKEECMWQAYKAHYARTKLKRGIPDRKKKIVKKKKLEGNEKWRALDIS
jgi:hypothetical protein